MFLVLGITGKVGGAVACDLLAKGHKVRALVRDLDKAAQWADNGVELQLGDFNCAASIAAALRGIENVFLMLPPFAVRTPELEKAQRFVDCFREALWTTPPRRVVVLSEVSSQHSGGVGIITATHLLEDGLADVPLPVAFVRAGSILENYSRNLQGAENTGILESFLVPTGRISPMVSTVDIGKEIARLLITNWSGKRIVELGSIISSDSLPIAIGEVLGRPLEAKAIPHAQRRIARRPRAFRSNS